MAHIFVNVYGIRSLYELTFTKKRHLSKLNMNNLAKEKTSLRITMLLGEPVTKAFYTAYAKGVPVELQAVLKQLKWT